MFTRVILIVLALLVSAIVGIGVWFWFYTDGAFRLWRKQMAIGATYMKSLKDSDAPAWIDRSKHLLSEWNPSLYPVGVYGSGSKPIPADLQRLGIVRIDILQDRVDYVWMGGMDHTDLEVDRLPGGTFQFIANYDDYKSEVIWPKRPNNSLQPTATVPPVLTKP
jgi:hypothetical protein